MAIHREEKAEKAEMVGMAMVMTEEQEWDRKRAKLRANLRAKRPPTRYWADFFSSFDSPAFIGAQPVRNNERSPKIGAKTQITM